MFKKSTLHNKLFLSFHLKPVVEKPIDMKVPEPSMSTFLPLLDPSIREACSTQLYWNSWYRHHTMCSEVSRKCSKGIVAGEDGVLAGVPGTLLHHVGAMVLGDSIHRAGQGWGGQA